MGKNSYPDFCTPCTVSLAALHKRQRSPFVLLLLLTKEKRYSELQKRHEKQPATDSASEQTTRSKGQSLHPNMSNMSNKEKR